MTAKKAFSVSRDETPGQYSDFVGGVYGVLNDRSYAIWDMLSNMQKFSMRSIKGIRKKDRQEVTANLLLSLSWYTSLMNRLHVGVDDIVWNRFPYLCSYCGRRPCVCKAAKVERRTAVKGIESMRPRTIREFQEMFRKIYPPESRTLEDAGIHLAEEVGELFEAFHMYLGRHRDADFDSILLESADFYSCAMGVFNSLGVDYSDELAGMFPHNCNVCNNAPCTCTFDFVSGYKHRHD
jgi:NTP pyrophosphatase (non-canonical NTP hydrolase)